MTYLVTDNTTFLWSILLQPLLHCYNLSRFSQCYIAMTYLVTAIQPILYCYALSRYSQYYTDMIYSVTANTTLLWSIPLQPILHCYDLFCYSQYYIAMIYLTTVNTTLLWYNKRNTLIILIQQQLILLYTTDTTRYEIWIQKPIALLSMNKATTRCCWRTPPMRTPGAARRTPRQSPRQWILCYYTVFLLFCHFCYSISAYPKTHKPRGRASDVSTISTCFSLCYNILPTPPPISVRTAGGITVVYLCGF